jgi:hypothetical protein
MSLSTAQLIAAGERALKRKSPGKKKAKRKTKKRAKRSRSRKTVVLAASELARLRKSMQTEIFGRPVRKKRKSAKKKAKRKPAKKTAPKKKAKRKAKKGPKPGSPAWVKKMALARKRAKR